MLNYSFKCLKSGWGKLRENRDFYSINLQQDVNLNRLDSSFYTSLNSIAYGCQNGRQMHILPCHERFSESVASNMLSIQIVNCKNSHTLQYIHSTALLILL